MVGRGLIWGAAVRAESLRRATRTARKPVLTWWTLVCPGRIRFGVRAPLRVRLLNYLHVCVPSQGLPCQLWHVRLGIDGPGLLAVRVLMIESGIFGITV
jgi:hypothetical protein